MLVVTQHACLVEFQKRFILILMNTLSIYLKVHLLEKHNDLFILKTRFFFYCQKRLL